MPIASFATVMRSILLGLSLRMIDSSFDSTSFMWESMADLRNASGALYEMTSRPDPSHLKTKPFASKILMGQHLYISLTTIHSRIYGIADTIESILSGTVWPDHIYIFVSRDPHLLDLGVSPEFILSESKGRLRELAHLYPWISVIFTDNLGPHRKLLPLLAKKWNEDCVIVTIDDHETYRKRTLESLIKYYEASNRNAVVALRARRLGICSDAPPWHVSPYTKNKKGLWPEASPSLNEMLILPTGTGGVLYHPKFFHPIIFDRKLMNITKTGDDLMFRLSTLMMGVPVVTACAEIDALGRVCPSKIRQSINENTMKLLPNMMDFTFNVSYNVKSVRENFVPPELYSKGIPTINKHVQPGISKLNTTAGGVDDEKKKKHRLKHRKDMNITSAIEQSVSNNFARRRLRLSENVKIIRFDIPEESQNKTKTIVISVEESGKKSDRKRELTLKPNKPVACKNDPRKTESLASKFNTGGGNNMMWDVSLEYLYNEKILDFHKFLQIYAPFERRKCLLSESILSSKESTNFGVLNHYIDIMKVAVQSSYEPQCGISICDKKNRRKQ